MAGPGLGHARFPARQDYPPAALRASVPLDPKLRERIDYELATYPLSGTPSIPDGRRIEKVLAAETDRLAGAPPPLERVEDHSVPLPGRHLPIRFYYPRGLASTAPVFLFLHGGGWVFGSIETHDTQCREIAARSGVVVAALEYRLAPEHKFPDAVEDSYGTLRWLADPSVAERFGLRPDAIAVGGTSAGGNLAAVAAILARDGGGPRLSGQALIYPVTAHDPDTPSYRENAHGYGLEVEFMPWMWAQYLSAPEQGQDPRVAPLRTPDLQGVAPALVITAEYDLLRDEAEQFADRLREAGVPTRSTRYLGMVHGFIDYRGLCHEGWDALDEIAGCLRQWVRTAPTQSG